MADGGDQPMDNDENRSVYSDSGQRRNLKPKKQTHAQKMRRKRERQRLPLDVGVVIVKFLPPLSEKRGRSQPFYFGDSYWVLSYSTSVKDPKRLDFYLEKLKMAKNWQIKVSGLLKIIANQKSIPSFKAKFKQIFTSPEDNILTLTKITTTSVVQSGSHYLDDGGNFNVWLKLKATPLELDEKKSAYIDFTLPPDDLNNKNNYQANMKLIVNNRTLHINKTYVAMHSTFFERLLKSANPGEAVKIEDKNILCADVEQFLEFIHPSTRAIGRKYVERYLTLAKMFESKVLTQLCERYLLKHLYKFSNRKLLLLADKFDLSNLMCKMLNIIDTPKEVTRFIEAAQKMSLSERCSDALARKLEFSSLFKKMTNRDYAGAKMTDMHRSTVTMTRRQKLRLKRRRADSDPPLNLNISLADANNRDMAAAAGSDVGGGDVQMADNA